MSLLRGTITAVDANQVCSVRLDGSASQAVDSVPSSPGIPPGDVALGRRVIVDTGLSGEAGELVIIAVASGGPSVLFGATLPQLTAAASAAGASIVAARIDHVHGQGLITTKGDVLHFGAAPARLPVGVNRQQLIADSAQAAGLAWASPGDLSRAATLLDVVNTVVETSIFSFSVPANMLGTNRMLRLTLFGDYLNNSGAGSTLNLKVKFGATTLYSEITASFASSAQRRAMNLVLWLAAQNSASAQVLGGLFALASNAAATTGLGDLNANATLSNPIGQATSAEDSTAAKTLDVLVTHGVAAATISARRFYACLELV